MVGLSQCQDLLEYSRGTFEYSRSKNCKEFARVCHLQRVVVYYIELDLQEKFLIYQENTVKWNLIIYRIYCNKIFKKQI